MELSDWLNIHGVGYNPNHIVFRVYYFFDYFEALGFSELWEGELCLQPMKVNAYWKVKI